MEQMKKAEIEKLPKIPLNIGGTVREVYYDQEQSVAFCPDGGDGYIRKKLIKKPPAEEPLAPAQKLEEPAQEPEVTEEQPEVSQETPQMELTDEKAQEEPDPETDGEPEESESSVQPPVGKRFPWGKVVVGIVLLCGLLFGVAYARAASLVKQQTATEPDESTSAATTEAAPSTTQAPIETLAPTEAVEGISLLVITEELLPGEQITEENVTTYTVTETEYRQLAASGGAYMEKDAQKVYGLVATDYISAGAFLNYDNVGLFFSPINPWEYSQNGTYTVSLPITVTAETLTSHLWGTQANITVTIRTKYNNPNAQEETQAQTPGVQHDSSMVEAMVVDTYTIQSARIVDLLDSNGKSLFVPYISLSYIPAAYREDSLAERYREAELVSADTPAFAVVSVTKEQAEVLSQLDQSSMTVELAAGTAAGQDQSQAQTYAVLEQIAGAISQAWKENG